AGSDAQLARVFEAARTGSGKTSARGADRPGHAGGRAGKAACHAERIVHSARARAGEARADTGTNRGGGGRGEYGIAGIIGYAPAGGVPDAVVRYKPAMGRQECW